MGNNVKLTHDKGMLVKGLKIALEGLKKVALDEIWLDRELPEGVADLRKNAWSAFCEAQLQLKSATQFDEFD